MPSKTTCQYKCEQVFGKNKTEWLETVYHCLHRYYGKQEPALKFDSIFQLMIMVVLSAQESDAKINKVAESFFKQFPDCKSIANADVKELEQALRHVGLYRQKAKRIKELCQKIQEQFGGKIPDNIDTLIQLPGIGRKSANAIIGYGFGLPAVVVDRHFQRVVSRIGLFDDVTNKQVDKIEFAVKQVLNKRYWIQLSLLFQTHGREICRPRPRCQVCPIVCCCKYGRHTVGCDKSG